MRCVAIIVVRNGASYIKNCLNYLFSNGIEVAIIDHESNDGTYELCESFKDDGLCYLGKMPYDGFFSLSDQLKEKQKILANINTDWVIHQDVDECLAPPLLGITLKEGIEKEDSEGYNCINFNEFVFLPYDGFFLDSCSYYYFSPSKLRLMRAWKKTAALSNIETGGHRLKGVLNISPTTYLLRHYIFISQQHAYDKYSIRNFSKQETAKGWHMARIGVPKQKMLFPDKSILKELPHLNSRLFDTSEPWLKHYWKK